ncbi:CotH kinase family protein [Ruminococcus sp.]|uniref:CotH kinase family protein n=1 Tax=Ruminococcus sp. TaxID=41978 RepID=UPI002E81EA18|nr:CotH kinase family protein [Ruminococcus sp.]MEE3491514.1 CotH kinase family protein [Ruminococcus sp.]
MKRLISLILCLMVITSLAVFHTSAEETSFSGEPEPVVPDDAVYAADGFAKTDADLASTGVTLDDPIIVPRIVVTTENGNGTTLQKSDDYQNAAITITDTDGSVLSDSCSFKVRGNTTAMTFVEKKAYTFKFEKKKDVLGMGKAKKWALLANTFDPTMLRNYMGFEFAHHLGLPYTSEHRFVEVFLDGSYRGCYELVEPIQEGKERVNIDIESNDGKKDFLIEYEAQRVEEDTTYFTVDGLRFIASDPDEPDEDQLDYIIDTMTAVTDTMKNGSKEEIEAVIDVPSFAKFYLFNEYFKTMDFDMSSVFFFYQDGKLYAGPAWDYDMSTGNTNADLVSARARNTAKTDGILQDTKNLYKYIGKKSWFIDEVKKVYEENYDYMVSLFAENGLLDTWSKESKAIFDRNWTVWRVTRQWYNYQKKPLSTYQLNLDYLKNWLNERNSWLFDYYDLFSYEYLRGDADGNHELEVVDATTIQRVLAGLSVQDEDGHMALRATVTDDELSITDATAIQRYLASLDNIYELDTTVKVKLREK